MDLIYPFVFSTFVVVVSFSLGFVVYISKPAVDRKLPPGRKGWPVFGENLEFLVNGWNGHPEKFIMDRMAKFSPQVFRTSLMLEDVAVFCGSAGNKFLFSNENKLVMSWWPASVEKVIPIASMNKSNIIKRNMISKYFKSEAIRQFIPIMDMVAQKHFETEWKGMGQVVTQNLTRNYTFLVACKTFVSIDKPEHVKYLIDAFVTLAKGIFTIPIDLPGTPLRKAMNASKFMRKEFIGMIEKRKIDLANGKASPSQDILSQMICDDDGKFIEEYDIADVIIGLLTAGDNASSTCAFIVKYLAELPDIYQGVYKEQMEIARSKAPGELLNMRDLSKMKYSWNVACEVLRLAPPVQGTFRAAISDFVYNGYSIPKGWKLYWSVNSTHRNPEFFHEPQKLDPSRFDGQGPTPYTFVPFGGGPHTCPGKEYARLEILVFMHHLVRSFKWKKVIPNERIVVNPMPIFAKGLPIRLYPHEV